MFLDLWRTSLHTFKQQHQLPFSLLHLLIFNKYFIISIIQYFFYHPYFSIIFKSLFPILSQISFQISASMLQIAFHQLPLALFLPCFTCPSPMHFHGLFLLPLYHCHSFLTLLSLPAQSYAHSWIHFFVPLAYLPLCYIFLNTHKWSLHSLLLLDTSFHLSKHLWTNHICIWTAHQDFDLAINTLTSPNIN